MTSTKAIAATETGQGEVNDGGVPHFLKSIQTLSSDLPNEFKALQKRNSSIRDLPDEVKKNIVLKREK